MKRIAILQSNYIPWKGYFDLIGAVDEFVIYDEMQYTRRDWRNRNQIKTPQGLKWLSVPVLVKGKYHQKISETEIDGDGWASNHWKSLEQNYRKAPYFSEISEWLYPLYSGSYRYLSELNMAFIQEICAYLEISTLITSSAQYSLSGEKSERLANICVQAGGNEYISGPSARNYMDESVFITKGLKLSWFNYEGYEEYPQLWGDFIHHVTILDLLFNCGKDSRKFMKLTKK